MHKNWYKQAYNKTRSFFFLLYLKLDIFVILSQRLHDNSCQYWVACLNHIMSGLLLPVAVGKFGQFVHSKVKSNILLLY